MNEAKSSVTIVVVNWNTGKMLRECIDSIILYGQDLIDQIIVVDNGSIDGSELFIKGLPKVTLVQAGQNLGFAKACNLGASKSHSEYILFLNPDSRLYADSLQGSLGFMNLPERSHVGICGIQLIDESSRVAKSCARFPTVFMFMAVSLGLNKLCPHLFRSHHMQDWDHNDSMVVDHVIGAFFLVRQKVFLQLEGFDERFFVYLEDLDFSLRAKKAGWESFYLADPQAFHAGGGASNQVKAKRLFYSIRSRILYAFKHFYFLQAVLVLMSAISIEPVSRVIFAGLTKSWASAKETVGAYKLLFAWLIRCFFKGEIR